MNRDFLEVISSTPQDRRDLFLSAAKRLGTTEQNGINDLLVVFSTAPRKPTATACFPPHASPD